MKLYKIKQVLILFFIGLSVFAIVSSCETTQETFEQFTEGGETILLGKPLSVNIQSGNLRAKFNIEVNADPKIKRGVISWIGQDGSDKTHEFPVERTSNGSEILEVLVNNIDEGSRPFAITFFDDNGHTSLPFDIPSTSIFGSIYASNLLAREVTEIITRIDGTAEINLSDNIADGMTDTTLSYEDADGVAREVIVTNDQTNVVLESYNQSVKLEVSSSFMPTTDAIDVFISASTLYDFPRVSVPLDISSAIVLNLNGDIPGNPAGWSNLTHTWDTDPGTFTASLGVPPPFSFSVDLGLSEPRELEEVTWYSFAWYPDIDTREYQIWGTDDITDADTTVDIGADFAGWQTEMESKGWVKLTEQEYQSAYRNASAAHKIVNETKVRYLRVVVLENFDPRRPGTNDFAWGGISFKAYLP